MLQIVVKRPERFAALRRLPASEKYLRLDLRSLGRVRDEALLGHLYRRVGLHSGISKQTSANRFAALEDTTLELLAGFDCPHIHDVGVSSGITSVELYEAASRRQLNFKLTVSDRYAQFYAEQRGLATHIFDADARLQCSYLAMLYGDHHTGWKYPLSVLLHRSAPDKPGTNAQGFLLYHPKLLTLIDAGKAANIAFDVLEPSQLAQFDYVRCMNLLNAGYFSSADLAQGLKVLAASLRPEGILQIGRTDQQGVNNVGFYRLTGSQFSLVKNIGAGSEIASLIEQVRIDSSAPPRTDPGHSKSATQ